MYLQEYQAEGRTNTPTKASPAATMNDCVGSELPDPAGEVLDGTGQSNDDCCSQ